MKCHDAWKERYVHRKSVQRLCTLIDVYLMDPHVHFVLCDIA